MDPVYALASASEIGYTIVYLGVAFPVALALSFLISRAGRWIERLLAVRDLDPNLRRRYIEREHERFAEWNEPTFDEAWSDERRAA